MSRKRFRTILTLCNIGPIWNRSKSWVSRVVQYVSEQFQGTYGIWSHSMSAQHCPDRSGSIDAEKPCIPTLPRPIQLTGGKQFTRTKFHLTDIIETRCTLPSRTTSSYISTTSSSIRITPWNIILTAEELFAHDAMLARAMMEIHPFHVPTFTESWWDRAFLFEPRPSPLPRWYVEVRRLLLCGTNGSSHVSNTSGFFVPQERTRIEKVLRIFLTAEGFSSLLNTISYDTL